MKKRDKSILRITICFLVIGILMSLNLWLNDRNFPLIPIIEIFKAPILFGYLNIIGVFIVCIVCIFFPQRLYIIGLVSLLISLAIQDQIRWQPWFYHYLIFLFFFCLKRESINISYFQIIIAGIYFWGGFNKFNVNFIDHVFPNFIFQITNWEFITFPKIGYIIPIVELIIAIGLLFKKTQNWAIYGAFMTHLIILVYLSPIGSNTNSIVIPWNIAMICYLYLCFYKTENKSPFKGIMKNSKKNLEIIVICLVLILPTLSFWEKWSYFLSFNLYSGKNEIFYIAVEEEHVNKLKIDFRKSFVQIEGLEGGKLIDINRWSINELNVPLPPEKRIFKAIANYFCDLEAPNEKVMFLEIEKPIEKGNIKSYTCNELRK